MASTSTSAAPLAEYIRKACDAIDFGINPIDEIFKNSSSPRHPRLSEGANRILVFPGNFNPPHKGHLSLLQSVYEYGYPPGTVLGAIIVPYSNAKVEFGASRPTNTDGFVLSLAERVRLWQEHHDRGSDFQTWTWTFPFGEVPFAALKKELVRRFVKEGRQIFFDLVLGPDHLEENRDWTQAFSWIGATNVITSNICRRADFASKDAVPHTLYGCDFFEGQTPVPRRFTAPFTGALHGLEEVIHIHYVEHQDRNRLPPFLSSKMIRNLVKDRGLDAFHLRQCRLALSDQLLEEILHAKNFTRVLRRAFVPRRQIEDFRYQLKWSAESTNPSNISDTLASLDATSSASSDLDRNCLSSKSQTAATSSTSPDLDRNGVSTNSTTEATTDSEGLGLSWNQSIDDAIRHACGEEGLNALTKFISIAVIKYDERNAIERTMQMVNADRQSHNGTVDANAAGGRMYQSRSSEEDDEMYLGDNEAED